MKPLENAHANLGSRLVREIDFDDLIYYQNHLINQPFLGWRSWKIKETFERIGIPEAERAYLAGASAQYESEVVSPQHEGRVPEIGDCLQIRILPSRNTQTCLNNTLPSWYHQQIISWLPLTQQYGLVEPLSTYQKGQGRYPTSNLLPYQQRKYWSVWTYLDYRWWGSKCPLCWRMYSANLFK